MQESKTHRNRVQIALLIMMVMAAFAVIAGVTRFLRVSLSALGVIIALPSGYSAGRSAVIVAVIGFVAMALIQGVRTMFPLRAYFHEQELLRWFRATEHEILAWKKDQSEKSYQQYYPALNQQESPSIEQRASADTEAVLELASVTDRTAFFNAPVEQICGQLSAIAEFLIGDPPEDGTGTQTFGSGPPKEKRESYGFLLIALAGPAGAIDALKTPGRGVQKIDGKDQRSNLGYYVQRNIDQLQISVSNRWQRVLRVVAMLISFCIALTVVSQGLQRSPDVSVSYPDAYNALHEFGGLGRFELALVIGLISGYLASVFRDIAAIIERLRR